MQLAMLAALVACLVVTPHAIEQATGSQVLTNPIRKVVTMLQNMQKKVEEEGKAEAALYEKFMCYCQTGGGELTASITAAESKVPAVTSALEEAEEKLAQTKLDLKQAQTDRASAKDATAEAAALREKEAKEFAAEKAEYDANIGALTKAIAALEKGMAGGFLQTQAAQTLRQLAVSKQDMLDVDRQELVAFLSGTQNEGYSPKSGEITGILKEMLDSMSKSLAEATSEEKNSIESFDALMSAKTKEVEALAQSIEAKTQQIGDLGVSIVQMQEDLSDTQAALLEDKKFFAGLTKNCASKTAEWEERSKTRAEELVALADTIKVLNDDDALDLFKKTLPGESASASASFVQMVKADASAVRARALAIIHGARHAAGNGAGVGLDLLAVALSGRKGLSRGGFEKVIKMCDSMIEVLKKEQVDDDGKKEYCAAQLDKADDKKKATERSIEDETQALATTEESISTLTDEIKALEAGIKELDKSVIAATEQRKDEHEEYKELMAADGAAKELLGFAKNRLNKFYNPKLYVAPPKVELWTEDSIASNFGDAPTTTAPGGIAGTGIAVLVQVSTHHQHKDAPAPPPETWDAYATKSQESKGVIAMIDLLIRDLDKEMAEADTEEKNSQAEYEKMMLDSAEKRKTDSKSLSDKVAAKADLEADIEARKERKSAAGKELMATLKFIQSLHTECDWLLQYYDVRKEARNGEIDSLTKAKAILSGADFSFVQTREHGLLRGRPSV